MNSIKIKIIISFIILLVLSSTLLGYFTVNTTQSSLIEEVEKSLTSLVQEGAKVAKSRIETQKTALEIIAGIEDIESMNLQLQRPALQREVDKTDFLALGIVYPDGTAYYHDGTIAKLGDRKYVKKAFNGETNLSDVLISRVTNEPVVMFATPIKKDGQIVGVLIGRRDGNALSNITNDIVYGKTGYAYIINDKGVVVAHKDKDKVLNQWNPIEEAKNNKEFESVEKTVKNMITNKTGIESYTLNNEDIYNAYTEIEGTNWIIAIAVDKDEALDTVSKLKETIIKIALIILIVGIGISFFIGSSLAEPIITAVKHTKTVASLDLTKEIPQKYLKQKDEIGMLTRALETMQNALKGTIENIKERSSEVTTYSDSLAATSEEMSASSEELASTMQQVANGATRQAEDLNEMVNALSYLTTNIENVYKELENVKNETENAENKANIGKQEMDILIKSIESIKDAFNVVISKVATLTNSVKEISGITDIISSISEQTNLLALNAAIEAARAGEHGKGFAVVAEEVRKLAEDSRQSTEKIIDLVESISKDTDEVIITSKDVENSVKEQTIAVENTVKSFEDILKSVENITPLMKKTYNVMDEIVKSKDIVIDRAEQVSSVTEENSAATEEVAASSEEMTASSEEVAATAQNLSEIAMDLMEAINRFKV